jgi:hypothetical protein
LSEWKLDQKTTEFLQSVRFADSGSIHSIGFQVQDQTGGVEEIVAAGTNNNGKIVLAYIRSKA